MICGALQRRGIDEWGSGEFGANRGSRSHNGVDFLAEPGMLIMSPVAGTITKLGFCYDDDLRYRYVQITTETQYRHRIFYISPVVDLDHQIKKGDPIGHCQSLKIRYPPRDGKIFPIPNHIHYEIIGPSGAFIRH